MKIQVKVCLCWVCGLIKPLLTSKCQEERSRKHEQEEGSDYHETNNVFSDDAAQDLLVGTNVSDGKTWKKRYYRGFLMNTSAERQRQEEGGQRDNLKRAGRTEKGRGKTKGKSVCVWKKRENKRLVRFDWFLLCRKSACLPVWDWLQFTMQMVWLNVQHEVYSEQRVLCTCVCKQ